MTDDYDYADLERGLATIQTKRRTWLIRTGKAFRAIFIACLGLTLAFNAPSIWDRPLGQVTLSELVHTALLIGLSLGCVKWLFAGTTDEAAEYWGGWALVLTALLIAALLILNR